MAIPVPGYRVGTPFHKPGSWAAGWHTGLDMPAPVGSRVVSMTAGQVVHVGFGGWGQAYGVQVIVDQGGGIRHAYCHLSRTSVRVGQSVGAGTQVGNVGVTGRTFGPHCHIETRKAPFRYATDCLNPANYFGASGGAAPASSGGGGGGVYLSKLRSGQRDSDSVRALQAALNRVHLPPPGNITLPITGNFGPKTEQVVITHQRVKGFGNDQPGHVTVGPRQAAALGLRVIG